MQLKLLRVMDVYKKKYKLSSHFHVEDDTLTFTTGGRGSRQRRRKRRAEMRLLARQVQNEPEQMQENGSEQMLDGNNPNILVDDTENDDATTEG